MNSDFEMLKCLLFEVYSAGFEAGLCSYIGLDEAYNNYWRRLMKEIKK